MKVLICSLNFYPELTATGKYSGEMAHWFTQNGHNVTAICAAPHYPQWKVYDGYSKLAFRKEYAHGVTILRTPCYIPSQKKLSAFSRILMETTFSLLSFRWWLPIIFGVKKFDVVIAVCPPMQTALPAWLYRTIRRVPYVFHIQDLQVDMALELGIMKRNSITRLLYKIESALLRNATKVSTISPAMRTKVCQKGVTNENVILCPNWSNIKHIKSASRQNRFREIHGVASNEFLVMYAGAMGEKQGIELILYAAKKLNDIKNIKFFIIGNGGNRTNLEKLASQLSLKNTTFLDIQPLDYLSDMLCSADVHLVVQKKEASDFVLPSKITNIFASRRACIVTAEASSSLGSLILENKTGVLVNPDDSTALADSILKLRADPRLSKELGENARKFAENSLDIDSIMKNFEFELKSMLSD